MPVPVRVGTPCFLLAPNREAPFICQVNWGVQQRRASQLSLLHFYQNQQPCISQLCLPVLCIIIVTTNKDALLYGGQFTSHLKFRFIVEWSLQKVLAGSVNTKAGYKLLCCSHLPLQKPTVRDLNLFLIYIYIQIYIYIYQKYAYDLVLTLQRRRTFKLFRSLRTEEFKFPTSSAPVCIRGIDLRFHTCRWMPYVV